MYTRHAPTATTAITKSAVGKTMSAMTTLPSLSWLGHKLMPEVLAFGAKALFDCANIRACGHDAFGRPQIKSRAVMTARRFPPPWSVEDIGPLSSLKTEAGQPQINLD